jgi:eukaryotic-like serine/threonine-protein kinase
MIPERLGSYRILEAIGQGPLTVVYRAVQEPLGRTVAIKALRDSISPSSPLASQLEREAHLLATLGHEGILTLHDFVKTDEVMYMVLEHVDGMSLASLMERAPKGLGAAAALSIAAAVAAALAHAHERGVVHRDVKPANILLSLEGQVKLADFGIAHDERLPSSPEPIEGTGGFGTPAYMSPEQVLGEGLDARSDVFSLGIVLYQMLAGVRPFDAPDARAITQRIRHDAPTPLLQVAPSVPAQTARLVERCLEKAPEHRHPSAAALIDAIERTAAELELTPSPREVVAALLKAGFIEQPTAQRAAAPRASAPAREGLGRAAAGQLFVLFSMVLGGSAIQSNVQGAEVFATERGEALELVPEKAAALRVLARPWAAVYIDGQLVDTTPFARAIPLRAGEHEVLLRHPSAPDERRVLKLAEGETALVEAEMKVPPPPAPPPPPPSAAPTSSTPLRALRKDSWPMPISRPSLMLRAALLAVVAPAAGCTPRSEAPSPRLGQGPTQQRTVDIPSPGGSAAPAESGRPAPPSRKARPASCLDAVPIKVAGQATGFERCAGGTTHRSAVLTCPSLLPRATSCSRGAQDACEKDRDCKSANDFCEAHELGGRSCQCIAGCRSDDDCGAGTLCACGDPIGLCVQASCRRDADCPGGKRCLSFRTDDVCSFRQAFACEADEDECRSAGDCPAQENRSDVYCGFDGKKRVCKAFDTICGRPLSTPGGPRLAGLRACALWRA